VSAISHARSRLRNGRSVRIVAGGGKAQPVLFNDAHNRLVETPSVHRHRRLT